MKFNFTFPQQVVSLIDFDKVQPTITDEKFVPNKMPRKKKKAHIKKYGRDSYRLFRAIKIEMLPVDNTDKYIWDWIQSNIIKP